MDNQYVGTYCVQVLRKSLWLSNENPKRGNLQTFDIPNLSRYGLHYDD
jgi:hypothetical protein